MSSSPYNKKDEDNIKLRPLVLKQSVLDKTGLSNKRLDLR